MHSLTPGRRSNGDLAFCLDKVVHSRTDMRLVNKIPTPTQPVSLCKPLLVTLGGKQIYLNKGHIKFPVHIEYFWVFWTVCL